jgi:hypothetical protein
VTLLSAENDSTWSCISAAAWLSKRCSRTKGLVIVQRDALLDHRHQAEPSPGISSLKHGEIAGEDGDSMVCKRAMIHC